MDRQEWLVWRSQGVGGSDAPAVLGISPYQTPFQLWEEKTGKVTLERDTNEYITKKGNLYESFARSKYELINDMEMPPVRYEHQEISYLRATLDGGNQEEKKGIEIKYNGKAVHEAAKKLKQIPEHHMAQMQHQLFVTGFKSIDYLSYYVASGKDEKGNKIKPEPKKGELVVVEVVPNMEWIHNYLIKAIEFWQLVQTDTPPPLTDKDTRTILKHDDLALKYVEAKKILDHAETACFELKKEIENIAAGIVRAEFGKTGLTVVKSYRMGNVDYKKIPELKGVNLDQYRGRSSQVFRINIPKEKE